MKCLITGHRVFKLKNYDCGWIKFYLHVIFQENPELSYGLSGMASGVDLWFCEALKDRKIPYAACIPFEDQDKQMENQEEIDLRESLIKSAAQIYRIRNSKMVEMADCGIVVWDGNKGGTHNVVQQMVENKKPFFWMNPVSEKVWKCF